MTTDHDDEGLAPVTDLFGARSRRRPSAPPSPDEAQATRNPTRNPTRDATPNGFDPDQFAPIERIAAARSRAADAAAADADADAIAGDDIPEDGAAEGDADADTPVPLPFTGSRAQPEWVSPVVGDGTGRSARAEQDGYDDTPTAEATTASVFAIASGDEIDPADAPRPIDEQRADAERLSMRALGRKGVSESELRTMLTKNDLDADVVDSEIERLTRVGLLDDVALATDLVDRLHDRKGLGRQGVVAELRRRGIDQAAIDAALDAAADDEDDEFVRAIELAQKRAGQLRGLDRATAERRLSGFLMRKGYNGGVVRIAVERALDGGGRPPAGPRGSVRFE
ncbi:regulatory protein [Curtobacterium sp. UNCCL20]|uniref:regulatory protein RecX n=1 Tax=Curtobacterium sp. UNCCL20 TaxID=1502773 RepID=UPI000891CCC8|nr:regulatory protein RecX [Curtobacterium sp. UNCCL20]SDQ42066.1 regulatory protein [Curtobacterium sp. UNCCL20]